MRDTSPKAVDKQFSLNLILIEDLKALKCPEYEDHYNMHGNVGILGASWCLAPCMGTAALRFPASSIPSAQG